MTLPPLGLYIHLPWCEKKCPYCDFNSHETDRIPENQYIQALLQDLRADLPMVQGRDVETLFIGGGTPSLFSAQGIDYLMREIDNMIPLSPTLEATMEANPGSAEADKFLAFRAAGINRLSLGIQSFNDVQLEALGRVHSSDEALAAIEFAEKADFDSINLDLMHGLPGQSTTEAEADLRCAINCAPAHLSWYQLTVEPNTVFHKRRPQLPIEDELADIQYCGELLLEQGGYKQYEVSAYSQADQNCRHNCNYWRFGDYLGIGAGAHGKISFTDGSIKRYAKTRQPVDYMSVEADKFIASSHKLIAEEIPGEFVMNALRLNRGFTLQEFTLRTGLTGDNLEPQLGSLCQQELLICESGVVRATDNGRRFLDTVVASFFPE